MGTITRLFEFDAAHRVMHEKVKCFNLHGHRFRVEITFEYGEAENLGYVIDFKELKRIAGTWLDLNLDHSYIANPMDTKIISLCREEGWKLYIMGFGEANDVNPSAENLASEIFTVMWNLFRKWKNLRVVSVRLYETPNCWVEVTEKCFMPTDYAFTLDSWRVLMGVKNYDDRKEDTPCHE